MKNTIDWNEFYERFCINHEEFMFFYNQKEIHLSFVINPDLSVKKVGVAYGKNDYYQPFDFDSTDEMLSAKIFDGKSLKDIWNELD